MPICGGPFLGSSAARNRPFASFFPIGRFGLTLGGEIPKRVERATTRGAEFDFVRFPPNAHQAVAADRRLRFTRAALLVEFPIPVRDVEFSPVHLSPGDPDAVAPSTSPRMRARTASGRVDHAATTVASSPSSGGTAAHSAARGGSADCV